MDSNSEYNFFHDSSIKFQSNFGSQFFPAFSSTLKKQDPPPPPTHPQIPVFLPSYPIRKQEQERNKSVIFDSVANQQINIFSDIPDVHLRNNFFTQQSTTLKEPKNISEKSNNNDTSNKILFMNRYDRRRDSSADAMINEFSKIQVRSKEKEKKRLNQNSDSESESQKYKSQKNINKNKNIIRDLCSKCGLYMESNPRALEIIDKQLGNDEKGKRELKGFVCELRRIKNFQEFRKFYSSKHRLIGLIKELSIEFLDKEAFVYIWNSSIAYKMETIKQIGHFRKGIEDIRKINQYRRSN